MNTTKEVAQDLRSALKRRRALLIITPILFVGISIAALFMIEPKYMSATSILVQKEETLNPLVLYEMAVSIASEDRLKSFNEIIYSRSTMELLIDSLALDTDIVSELDKQALILTLRKNIGTSSRASDSFEINYYDTDPVRARDGVALLANHFISTRLQLENRRNNETVDFFSDKLDELGKVVEQQRNQAVNVSANRMRESPVDADAMQLRLQGIDTQMGANDWGIYQEEQKLAVVNDYLSKAAQAGSVSILYRLPLDETPFGAELSGLLKEHDDLRQQFTDTYPQVRAVSDRIHQTAKRIPPAIEAGLLRLKLQKNTLSSQRSRVINDMERSYVAVQRANTQQSDFSIYEALYNEMKVKLEQARMTRDIGTRGAEQFVVLDPPFVPQKPSSPKKSLILGLGLALGLVVGIVISSVAEALDSTVRAEEDLKYDKPIIAYLPNG